MMMEIAFALEGLPRDDAMRALIEMQQAVILAQAGLEPGTPEFERVVTIALTLLCQRTFALTPAFGVTSATVRH